MKTHLILILSLLFMQCICFAQSYVINGEIKNMNNGTATIYINNSDRETIKTETTEIKDGKFQFKGTIDEPRSCSISIAPDGKEEAGLYFILENTTINVEANWNIVLEQYGYRFFSDFSVTGGKNNTFSREFNKLSDDILAKPEHKEFADALKKLDELRDENKTEEYNALREQLSRLGEKYYKEVEEAQIKYIKTNPDVESAANVMGFLKRNLSLDELNGLFNSLSEKVRNSDMAKDIREEIEARTVTQPGRLAPDFTLKQPSGENLSLSDLRGKIVLIDFWASWCGPCRAAIPDMKKIYDKYHSKGVEFLGVTNDSRHADWIKALEEEKMPWLQVIDEFHLKNKRAKVASMYAIPHLPTLVLVDKQGKIVKYVDDKEDLVRSLEKLVD